MPRGAGGLVVGTTVRAEASRVVRLLEELGRGRTGTVYRAELRGPSGLTRTVAVKVLHDGVDERRLLDEARAQGAIRRHRAVVGAEDLFRLDGRLALILEPVDGADLRRVLAGMGSVPAGAALELIAEIASALDAGVAAGVRHGDLRPANVLLTRRGEAKVLGFGAPAAATGTASARTLDLAYGSAGYLAPERFEGEDTAAGDVFALGVVAYELLTGHPLGRLLRVPRKHAEHVDDALLRAEEQGVPGGALELLRELLRFEAETRPTAAWVERRARELRARLRGPSLADWAEAAIRASAQRVTPSSAPRTPDPAPTKRRGWAWRWALLALLPLPPGFAAVGLVGAASWWLVGG